MNSDNENKSSDNEAPLTKQKTTQIKEKKPRSEKQIEQFKKAQAKRFENIEKINLNKKLEKTKAKLEKKVKDSHDVLNEIEKKKINKKEILIEESDSESEVKVKSESEEEVIVVQKKKKSVPKIKKEVVKKPKKTKKIIIEESSDSDNSSETDAYSTDSMRESLVFSKKKTNATSNPKGFDEPVPKQKTRNEMKSQRNKKSIIKVHEREQTTKQQKDFNPLLFFI